MGKAEREKGKRGEREVSNILKEYGYTQAKRGVQYHGGPDSPDVVGIPGIHFEVKRVETLNLKAAIKQSVNDAADDEIPVVVHRKSREPWYVTLSLEDFIPLVQGTQMAIEEGCCHWPEASKVWVGK